MKISNNRPRFQYPDASGVIRTWVPRCCKCKAIPTKCSTGYRNAQERERLPKDKNGFFISDYGALYCDQHAPDWAENI